MPFILGVVVLILLLWATNAFSKADPKQAARVLRVIGGCALLAFAAFVLLRGEIGVAILLGSIGLGLLGWTPLRPAIFYFDGRQSGRGEHPQGDAAAGNRSRAARGSKMTEEEAYQILGVKPGASAEDISRAHRSLIKKLHPDQGGSTYLAARVNEAKEVLLRRHY
jgi:nitrogen fixation-related uncharacterized protein